MKNRPEWQLKNDKKLAERATRQFQDVMYDKEDRFKFVIKDTYKIAKEDQGKTIYSYKPV